MAPQSHDLYLECPALCLISVEIKVKIKVNILNDCVLLQRIKNGGFPIGPGNYILYLYFLMNVDINLIFF